VSCGKWVRSEECCHPERSAGYLASVAEGSQTTKSLEMINKISVCKLYSKMY